MTARVSRNSRPPPSTSNAQRWRMSPDRIAVVLNGNAKLVTDAVIETLDQIVQSGDLFVSRSLREGRAIARTVVQRGYPTVLTGGGDGTFVQMVSFVLREADAAHTMPPRFGVLKLGTGNALAGSLGAEPLRGRAVVTDLQQLKRKTSSRELRLIRVEGTYCPFGGMGASAVTLQNYDVTKRMLQATPGVRHFSSGPITYALAIVGRSLPQYALRRPTRLRVQNCGRPAQRINHEGKPEPVVSSASQATAGDETLLYDGHAHMVVFGTIPYWGFGAKVLPYAQVRPDRFNLRLVSFRSAGVARHLRSLWTGAYRGHGVTDFLVDRVRIHCDPPAPTEIGGDVIGTREELEVALNSRPIRVVEFDS